MSTRRYTLPVETTQWRLPGSETETIFNWEYDEGRERLLGLYEKGKEAQWNASRALDWSVDVDMSDQGLMPDMQVPIFGSPTWEKLSRAEKDHVRHHVGAWLFSQFLHGEQGALVCTAKIVQTVPDIDSKFYAATQVIDEARHVEAYARFLNEKLELAYPINHHLKTLLDQTITDRRWDMTYLGMQMMIEGVAMAAFSMVRDLTQHPLGTSLNAFVMRDEARHVAFGVVALKDAYADLTAAERNEREEFVVEASYLLRDRFLAEEVWEHLGFDVKECVRYVNEAQIMSFFRKQLFSRVVPNVKTIGLWGPRIQAAYTDMGVIDFQNEDVEQTFAQDERIAAEIEQMLAARRAKGPLAGAGEAPPASRAAEIADTIARGQA